MSNVQKITPQAIKVTISLSDKSLIKTSNRAIDNNDSKKTSKQFIDSLKKAVGKDIFPNLSY